MPKPTLDGVIAADLASGWLAVDPSTGRVTHGGKREMRGHDYLRSMLTDGRFALSHRVVWIATHGSIPDGWTINHKNGDRRDNRPANLEPVTVGDNTRLNRRLDHYDHQVLDAFEAASGDASGVVAEARAMAERGATRAEVAAFIAQWRESRGAA